MAQYGVSAATTTNTPYPVVAVQPAGVASAAGEGSADDDDEDEDYEVVTAVVDDEDGAAVDDVDEDYEVGAAADDEDEDGPIKYGTFVMTKGLRDSRSGVTKRLVKKHKLPKLPHGRDSKIRSCPEDFQSASAVASTSALAGGGGGGGPADEVLNPLLPKLHVLGKTLCDLCTKLKLWLAAEHNAGFLCGAVFNMDPPEDDVAVFADYMDVSPTAEDIVGLRAKNPDWCSALFWVATNAAPLKRLTYQTFEYQLRRKWFKQPENPAHNADKVLNHFQLLQQKCRGSGFAQTLLMLLCDEPLWSHAKDCAKPSLLALLQTAYSTNGQGWDPDFDVPLMPLATFRSPTDRHPAADEGAPCVLPALPRSIFSRLVGPPNAQSHPERCLSLPRRLDDGDSDDDDDEEEDDEEDLLQPKFHCPLPTTELLTTTPGLMNVLLPVPSKTGHLRWAFHTVAKSSGMRHAKISLGSIRHAKASRANKNKYVLITALAAQLPIMKPDPLTHAPMDRNGATVPRELYLYDAGGKQDLQYISTIHCFVTNNFLPGDTAPVASDDGLVYRHNMFHNAPGAYTTPECSFGFTGFGNMVGNGPNGEGREEARRLVLQKAVEHLHSATQTGACYNNTFSFLRNQSTNYFEQKSRDIDRTASVGRRSKGACHSVGTKPRSKLPTFYSEVGAYFRRPDDRIAGNAFGPVPGNALSFSYMPGTAGSVRVLWNTNATDDAVGRIISIPYHSNESGIPDNLSQGFSVWPSVPCQKAQQEYQRLRKHWMEQRDMALTAGREFPHADVELKENAAFEYRWPIRKHLFVDCHAVIVGRASDPSRPMPFIYTALIYVPQGGLGTDAQTHVVYPTGSVVDECDRLGSQLKSVACNILREKADGTVELVTTDNFSEHDDGLGTSGFDAAPNWWVPSMSRGHSPFAEKTDYDPREVFAHLAGDIAFGERDAVFKITVSERDVGVCASSADTQEIKNLMRMRDGSPYPIRPLRHAIVGCVPHSALDTGFFTLRSVRHVPTRTDRALYCHPRHPIGEKAEQMSTSRAAGLIGGGGGGPGRKKKSKKSKSKSSRSKSSRSKRGRSKKDVSSDEDVDSSDSDSGDDAAPATATAAAAAGNVTCVVATPVPVPAKKARASRKKKKKKKSKDKHASKRSRPLTREELRLHKMTQQLEAERRGAAAGGFGQGAAAGGFGQTAGEQQLARLEAASGHIDLDFLAQTDTAVHGNAQVAAASGYDSDGSFSATIKKFKAQAGSFGLPSLSGSDGDGARGAGNEDAVCGGASFHLGAFSTGSSVGQGSSVGHGASAAADADGMTASQQETWAIAAGCGASAGHGAGAGSGVGAGRGAGTCSDALSTSGIL